MTTYLYEITYEQKGVHSYAHQRGQNKSDAAERLAKSIGDITVVSVSFFGN